MYTKFEGQMRKDGKRQIIWQLLQEYDIETAEDIQAALKDLLGDTIQEMMEAKMDIRLRLNVLLFFCYNIFPVLYNLGVRYCKKS